MVVPLTCPDVGTLQRLVLGQLPPDEIASLQEHLAHCPECLASVNDLPTDDPLLQAMRTLPAAGPEEAAVERLMERLRCGGPSSDTVCMDTFARDLAGADTARESSPETYDCLTGQHSSDELGWLGDYRVLRVLGGGGMGTVFEAEDALLQRPVALKVLKPSVARHPEAKQRFLGEARAAAAIQHDHIVTIHQVGEDRGIPYLAMQLLRGETLERRLQRFGRLPAGEVVRIGREVARGLAAAHARGLIHRDIKPGNIWLEDKPEGASIAQDQGGRKQNASGNHSYPAPPPLPFRVKILDFGLATAAAETTQTTSSGMLAGTPAYMAPEQASGGPIDHRCDLFGLGCVLYRACTGELPFKGSKPLTILWSLAVTQPPPPGRVNADVPQALSDLIEKLLAKDPADRPQSAREVADALRAIEADLARPPQPAPRLRRRLAVAATVVLTTLLTTVGCLYGPAVYRLVTDQGVVVVETDDPDVKVVVKQQEQQVTILDAKTNQEVTLKAGKYQIELSPQKEGLRLSATDFTLARGDKQIVRVRWEPGEVKSAAPVQTLHSPECVCDAQFCLDGNYVISEGRGNRWEGPGKWVTGPEFALRLWDAKTGREVAKLEDHTAPILCVAVSADGKRAATGGRDLDVRLWDLENRKVIRRFKGHTLPIRGVAITRDGRHLVSASEDKSVRLWDVETSQEIRSLDDTSPLWSVTVSRDGKRILSGNRSGALRLWNAATGDLVKSFETGADTVHWVRFSPDERLGLTNSASPAVRQWDLETGKEVYRFRHHQSGAITDLAFSRDGRRVLTCAWEDWTIRLWDAATGKELARFEGHEAPTTSVAFSPDDRFALSGSLDKTVRTWKLPPPEPVHTLVGHQEVVWAAQFCLGGTHVVSAGGNRWEEETKRWVIGSDFALRLWDVKTGREVKRFGDHSQIVRWIAVSPDGKRAVSAGGDVRADGGSDCTLRLWDLQTGKLVRHFAKRHTDAVVQLAFTTDGTRVVSAGRDKSVRLWDVETGQEIRCFEEGETAGLTNVDVSRNGKRIVSRSPSGKLHLWNAETGERIRSFDVVSGAVGASLSPDGGLALLGGPRSILELRDLEADKSIADFRHETGWVGSPALSPDGKRFLSHGQDGTVRLWDVTTRKELCRFETGSAIAIAAFSPDGRFAVSAGWDHNVRIWKLPE